MRKVTQKVTKPEAKSESKSELLMPQIPVPSAAHFRMDCLRLAKDMIHTTGQDIVAVAKHMSDYVLNEGGFSGQ